MTRSDGPGDPPDIDAGGQDDIHGRAVPATGSPSFARYRGLLRGRKTRANDDSKPVGVAGVVTTGSFSAPGPPECEPCSLGRRPGHQPGRPSCQGASRGIRQISIPLPAAIAFALAVFQGRQTRDASDPPCMGAASVGTGPTWGASRPGWTPRSPPSARCFWGDTGRPDRSRAHRAHPVFYNTPLGSKQELRLSDSAGDPGRSEGCLPRPPGAALTSITRAVPWRELFREPNRQKDV